MNKYEEEFKRYSEIASRDCSYEEVVEDVKKSLEFKSDFSGQEAVIVLGYSGNGKTTWVRQFRRDNPGYEIISFDDIVKRLTLENGSRVDSNMVVKAIGDAIDKLCVDECNIIFDGRFLNLFTRTALTQTLHSYGYFVSMVDITDYVDQILPKRIKDCWERDLGCKVDSRNFGDIIKNPTAKKRYDEIMKYYKFEKESSLFPLQKELDVVYLDCDFVMDVDGKTKNDFDSGEAHK